MTALFRYVVRAYEHAFPETLHVPVGPDGAFVGRLAWFWTGCNWLRRHGLVWAREGAPYWTAEWVWPWSERAREIKELEKEEWLRGKAVARVLALIDEVADQPEFRTPQL